MGRYRPSVVCVEPHGTVMAGQPRTLASGKNGANRIDAHSERPQERRCQSVASGGRSASAGVSHTSTPALSIARSTSARSASTPRFQRVSPSPAIPLRNTVRPSSAWWRVRRSIADSGRFSASAARATAEVHLAR